MKVRHIPKQEHTNKVLLIQVDGKFPNLALMKISTWHKLRGDKVFFNKSCNPGIVYISCIFEKNRSKALGMASFWKSMSKDTYIGGSGINLEAELPLQIEHLMPDYSLYDLDFSMGFTSRGCVRNCPFCIVPEKEGPMKDHAPIIEFWRPDHKKIILLDNNFLASPKWQENANFLICNDLKVNFNQGLDIRLINENNATFLANLRYYDWKFKKRRLHFAWDLMSYEGSVYHGIDILRDCGIPTRHLMFYVLVGFNTSLEDDLYRIQKLIELGIKPFVMPYNGHKHPLTRWINRRYYKVVPIRKWLNERSNS